MLSPGTPSPLIAPYLTSPYGDPSLLQPTPSGFNAASASQQGRIKRTMTIKEEPHDDLADVASAPSRPAMPMAPTPALSYYQRKLKDLQDQEAYSAALHQSVMNRIDRARAIRARFAAAQGRPMAPGMEYQTSAMWGSGA